jgi:cytoskeletal protein CcmA (bactofilin family)
VGAVEVTCTTGEDEGVVRGHVTGAGTAEVDGVIEGDILAAADLAVASICIYFKYLIYFVRVDV